MIAHLLSENIQKKISLLQKAISSRNPLPILQNILIETAEGKLIFSATDLEIGVQVSVPAKVEQEGGVTVPARAFLELISSLPSEKVTLSSTETTLTVQSRRTKSVFQIIPKEEFPRLFEEKGEQIAVVPNDILQTTLEKVIFSASVDSARPALTGVLLKQTEQGILLVATDAFRLSVAKLLPTTQGLIPEGSVLVQARVLREVLALKEEGDVAMYVSLENNQILFEENDTIIVGRLIEAEFPNYEKILPSDHETQAFFDKDDMQKAVKIGSIFARETDNVVRLSVGKETIVVSANTPSVGENTADLETQMTGEENAIAFNAKYLTELFSHLDHKEVLFEMTGPLNPGVFKLKGNENFLHVIMPIRVQS